MAEETVEVNVVEAPEVEAAESVAEVEAARAAASAEVAQEAAALAIVQAESTVADVAAVAATELETYQERLALCEARTAEMEQRWAATEEHLSLIRSRLETPPADPESPAEEPPSEPATEPEAEPEPPREPERAERKRAHRWI